MKKNRIKNPLLTCIMLVLSSVLLGGCRDKCKTERRYIYHEPIYTSLKEFRKSVKQVAPKDLKSLGKIYYKSGYLYLNEPGEGLHVIDNRDKSNPKQISFIEIPGNFSLAAKSDKLFVDSYVDLVVLDISNPTSIKETNRLKGVFNSYNYKFDSEKGIISGYKKIKKVEYTNGDCRGGGYYEGRPVPLAKGDASGKPTSQGVGGSMATFTVYSDYLYALEDKRDLITVNISDVSNPLVHTKQNIGFGVETLFPYQDKLFMGANDGMYIYDLSEPANPTKISKYGHVRSCDPVVVQGNYAYVTLRNGTRCRRGSNQLEVIDISNLYNPKLLHEYPMFNPHGLGIDGKALFICDGSAGLKIFDATDISKIKDNKIIQYGNINAFDVIPFNDLLMLIGKDGLFQYDYSNLKNIKLLSKIEVKE